MCISCKKSSFKQFIIKKVSYSTGYTPSMGSVLD
nr:MAG TPA: hypothetical protein [Caudoviricetes sp.]